MKGKIMEKLATKRRQGGITLIGFAIVLIVAAFFAYMGMILGPMYSEYYGVVKAMKFVASQADPSAKDVAPLQKALDRQFTVGYVERVSGKDAKLVRDKGGNRLVMEYEARKSFVYNIDLVAKFAHSEVLGNKQAGD